MAKIETQYQNVTPAMAKEFLAKNHPNNRTLSDTLVQKYADEIKNGRWVKTHQGIAFDSDGHMIDGQHRCAAIVKAGKAVSILVTTGLPATSIEGIDLNRVRRTADVLEIRAALPEGVSAQVASARAVVLHRLMQPATANGTLTVRVFDEIWSKYGPSIQWAASKFTGGGHTGTLQRKIRSAPVVGAIIAAHHVNPAPIEAFVNRLDTGVGITRQDDPAASLRRHLDSVMSLHGEGRMGITFATLRACYAAIHNQHVTVYRTATMTRTNPEFVKILRYFGFDSGSAE